MKGSTTKIPESREDIGPWVERLQRERLNDSGRDCIAVAGMLLRTMFDTIEQDAELRGRLETRIEELDELGEAGASKAATLDGQLARLPMPLDRMLKTTTKVTELLAKAYDADKTEAARRELKLDQALEADRAETDDWECTEGPTEPAPSPTPDLEDG